MRHTANTRWMLAGIAALLVGPVRHGACAAETGGTRPGGRIAILRDDVSGLDTVLVDELTALLRDAGFDVRPLSCARVADTDVLNAKQFSCLVLTHSPRFPLVAEEAFGEFLAAGGDIVLMGGHAFSEPVAEHDARWQTLAHIDRDVARSVEGSPLFTFDEGDLPRWRRGASNARAPSASSYVRGPDQRALRLDLKDVTWYEVYSTPITTRVPGTHNALVLLARGDRTTPELFVEIVEADGARWSRAVDVGTEWRRCILRQQTFLFKADGSPRHRGKRGDGLDLSRAAEIRLGLASERTRASRGDHTLWVDSIETARVAAAPARGRKFRFDGVFDDYDVHRLHDVTCVSARVGQDWLPVNFEKRGRFTGLSAIGWPYPGQSTFIPILDARDRHGRSRGWAGGVLVNFDGPYAGSQWAIFGIEQPSFYRGTECGDLLAKILRSFERGHFVTRARRESERSRARTQGLESPPLPALEIRDGHFVYPDGRRFFMIGVNLFNSFDRYYNKEWDVNALERDFQRMHRAGVNAVRIHGFRRFANPDSPERLGAFCEFARRYGVYILPSLIGHTEYFLDSDAMQGEARRIAGLLAEESAVLGFDLQNEPYWHKLAAIRHEGTTLGKMFPHGRGWRDYQRRLAVAPQDWTTTFPGLKGRLPVPTDSGLRRAFDSVNGIYGSWIKWQIEAVRSVDRTHPITVGYNTIFDCLPANEPLDFVSHHCYELPNSHHGLVVNVTTMDRLKMVWPDRPITLGEFAYSSGDVVGGAYLDVDSQAVGEMAHYLYALANGHDGVMKWQLCDWAPANQRRQATWRRKDPEAKRIRERRFGMYYADGTPEGRPKPTAYATRFLREYVDHGGMGGRLELKEGATAIGTVYAYENDNALFVGDVGWTSPRLSFRAQSPANVMLSWRDAMLKVMSTADAMVTITPALFLGGIGTRVTGRRGRTRVEGGRLEIEMLAGEALEIR